MKQPRLNYNYKNYKYNYKVNFLKLNNYKINFYICVFCENYKINFFYFDELNKYFKFTSFNKNILFKKIKIYYSINLIVFYF